MRLITFLIIVAVAQVAPIAEALSGWPASLSPSTTPLSTATPQLPGGVIANNVLPGPLYQDFQPPYPTDTWWAALGSSTQSSVAAGPFPFQSMALPGGISFGLATARSFDGISVHVDSLMEFTVNAAEVPSWDIRAHKATQWDSQTLTIKYFTPTNASSMFAYLVPGSPYMTFDYRNATPYINSTSPITSINGGSVSVGANYSATTFDIVTGGASYVVYFLSSTNVTLQVVSNANSVTSLKATAPTNVVMRFAKVTADAPRAVLDVYNATYATAVAMTYSVANDIGRFQYTWQTVGASPLMLLSWPHHRYLCSLLSLTFGLCPILEASMSNQLIKYSYI